MQGTYTNLVMTRRKWALFGFMLGLLPSLLLFYWANQRVNDMTQLFDLLRAANVGNLRMEVESQIGRNDQLSPEEQLRYQPQPAARAERTPTMHVSGRYLLYVWYDNSDRVFATFIAVRE